jgi:ribosomal protein L37AE/L43A
MTEHEEEYLRERRAEADAGARERKAQATCRRCGRPFSAQEARAGWSLCERCEHFFDRLSVTETTAAPSLLEAVRLAHATLDAATSTLAGLDLFPGSRLDELCGELAAARDACGVALGRAEGGTE